MKSRFLPLVISTALLLSLCACGKTDKKSSDVSKSDTGIVSKMDVDQENGASSAAGKGGSDEDENGNWSPYVAQRQVLVDEGSMCGVIYLGYAEADVFDLKSNRAYYDNMIEESGYAQDFDFMSHIPDDHFIGTPMGHDVYLIIPTDPNANVAVNYMIYDEEDDFAGRIGDILYTNTNGSPFLLQCNYSDIFSDASVVIVDSDGQMLTWSPFLSLRDGKVQKEAEDGKIVYDFTTYDYSDDDEYND